MSTVCANLFGTPVITIDGKKVFFSYNKVNALIYYLLVKHQATRDELIGLLWPDKDESTAKKNLRNALYEAKRTIGADILISPQKSVIMLNPAIQFKIDIEAFTLNPQANLSLYVGEFLQGFFVKRAESFENWYLNMRYHFSEQYQQVLMKQLQLVAQENKTEKIEQYARQLCQLDPFNEIPYRELMKAYEHHGSYGKAIKCYNQLAELLEREMAVVPGEETKQIFNRIVAAQNKKKISVKKQYGDFFFGRLQELQLLELNMDLFFTGQSGKSILITGEAGIGKTTLKEKFLAELDHETSIIEVNCYQMERDYLLKPWNSIIGQLSAYMAQIKITIPAIWETVLAKFFPEIQRTDENNCIKLIETMDLLKYEIIGEVLLDVLDSVVKDKKIVFVFEDIQWMDTLSLSLLSSIMLHQKERNFIFLATCRKEHEESLDQFITTMNAHNKILIIDLPRFTPDEARLFIEKALPGRQIQDELMKKIYEESEGTPFFLSEYANTLRAKGDVTVMTAKMNDVLKSRFFSISTGGKHVLAYAALFYDAIQLEMLTALLRADSLTTLESLEELERCGILKSISQDDSVAFTFTHQKLREFVYLHLSAGRRRISHQQVTELLEKKLQGKSRDAAIYRQLTYHYLAAGNKLKAMEYAVKNLNYYLSFSHELFPILKQTETDLSNYTYFSSKQTDLYMKEISSMLKSVQRTEPDDSRDVKQLEIEYLHIKGRYYIRSGCYREGCAVIKEMIKKSQELRDRDYALEGYKQMVYYCIQTNIADSMLQYVEKALELAVECNYHKEIGILLRLKGLYYIMVGQMIEAERLLNESINVFNITQSVAERYSLNIAAAYNYIGEIRRSSLQFDKAISYYDKAIAICKDPSAYSSLTVFYANAGEAAFNQENYVLAEHYFCQADNLYEKFDSIWRRSIVESFMALLAAQNGNFDQTLIHVKKAEIYATKIGNPRELGVLLSVKARLVRKYELLSRPLQKYLNQTLSVYSGQALQYLDPYRDQYEKNLMEYFLQ